MSSRGHMSRSFEGRPIQAPGMLRHGPFPGPGLGPVGHRHPREPLPPPEFLENKVAVQAAEMQRIARENRRLAETHEALRRELFATQQEIERAHGHVRSIHTESEIQMRGLMEKIGKAEADIRGGETAESELQQSHHEAQSALAARNELSAEIQRVTVELQKTTGDVEKLPEMQAELDEMRQQHQKLRVAFEYEKGSNMQQVERLQVMEKNLISMAREVEKLRAEVANAEKRASAPNPYGGAYGTPDPAGQGSSYPYGYGHISSGYGSYGDGYGQSQSAAAGGGEGMKAYGPRGAPASARR